MVTDPICLCGHPGDEHQDYAGRCGGECVDPEYGVLACLCHAFERDHDQ